MGIMRIAQKCQLWTTLIYSEGSACTDQDEGEVFNFQIPREGECNRIFEGVEVKEPINFGSLWVPTLSSLHLIHYVQSCHPADKASSSPVLEALEPHTKTTSPCKLRNPRHHDITLPGTVTWNRIPPFSCAKDSGPCGIWRWLSSSLLLIIPVLDRSWMK